MCAAKHDAKLTEHNFFKEQSCIHLVKILPQEPTAEFCASPVDNTFFNSTTLGTIKLGILHCNQHFSPVPG